LGAREGTIGYDAADEGLEDGGAEEGAVAMWCVSEGVWVLCWGRGRYLRRWYVVRSLNVDKDDMVG
jgi:hypothetical protein